MTQASVQEWRVSETRDSQQLQPLWAAFLLVKADSVNLLSTFTVLDRSTHIPGSGVEGFRIDWRMIHLRSQAPVVTLE